MSNTKFKIYCPLWAYYLKSQQNQHFLNIYPFFQFKKNIIYFCKSLTQFLISLTQSKIIYCVRVLKINFFLKRLIKSTIFEILEFILYFVLEFKLFVLELLNRRSNVNIKLNFTIIIIKSCISFTKFWVEIHKNLKKKGKFTSN